MLSAAHSYSAIYLTAGFLVWIRIYYIRNVHIYNSMTLPSEWWWWWRKTKKYRCIQSHSIQPQNENGTRIFRPRKSLREGNEKCIEMNFEAGINVRTKHNRNTQTYHQANESNSEYTMFSLISAQTRAIGGPEEGGMNGWVPERWLWLWYVSQTNSKKRLWANLLFIFLKFFASPIHLEEAGEEEEHEE